MRQISLVALIAAISFGGAAFAQNAVVSTDASVSASASASVSASTPDTSSVSSAVSSALSSASSEVSSLSSSVSSELSSTSSSVSSEISSAVSSEMSSAASSQNCGDFTAGDIATTAIDPSVLSSVTNVQVFSVSDCTNLSGLVSMDPGIAATIAANATVAAAMQAQGEAGAEVIGYAIDGTTLIVYVRHNA